MIPDACPAPQDVLAPAQSMSVPVRPANCAHLHQTPLEFTWPPPGPSERQDRRRYATVTLKFPDGHAESISTERNWLAWDQVLPAGEYRWRVTQPDGAKSAERRFTIEKDAKPFLIPDDLETLKRARSTPRPRTWTHDDKGAIAAIRAERSADFARSVRRVDELLNAPVQPEPKATSISANYDDTVGESKRTLAASLAWAVTRDRRYGEDAARRLVNQARWSAEGPLSYAVNDMASRTVAWTLALGYDWTHDFLDEAQKKSIRDAIRARTDQMYRALIADGRIWRQPYDSHGNLTLTLTAAIGALMAGDIPDADEWLKASARGAAVWTSPWGEGDGGFANGTMQAQWDTGSNLIGWYVLQNAAGIPIFQKQWVREHARYLAYFVPPGAPGNLFGDGQEMKDDALLDPARIEALVAPRPTPVLVDRKPGDRTVGGDNAALFPSIGWVAMHSDLADPNRTSVYFKSSPYGSYNHSHADQNAFVIDSAGERLAIASGYYDGYKTPHWRDWYKQTRAANAITFDGGQGQGIDGMQYSGAITDFDANARSDRATGDARAAYGGALTRAERTITYDRAANTVTVRDVLASATPRTWEWNLHSMKRMEPASSYRVSVRNGHALMCVEMQKSPGVEFTQTDEWTAPPSGKSEKQWHGRFATKEKTRTAEFVAVMRIGKEC